MNPGDVFLAVRPASDLADVITHFLVEGIINQHFEVVATDQDGVDHTFWLRPRLDQKLRCLPNGWEAIRCISDSGLLVNVILPPLEQRKERSATLTIVDILPGSNSN